VERLARALLFGLRSMLAEAVYWYSARRWLGQIVVAAHRLCVGRSDPRRLHARAGDWRVTRAHRRCGRHYIGRKHRVVSMASIVIACSVGARILAAVMGSLGGSKMTCAR
jgi:hypothetical protein